MSASPASFSVQNTPQSLMLTAATSLAIGNYSFVLNGTSGSLSGSTTVNVGVGALANFQIDQPLFSEVITRFGSGIASLHVV